MMIVSATRILASATVLLFVTSLVIDGMRLYRTPSTSLSPAAAEEIASSSSTISFGDNNSEPSPQTGVDRGGSSSTSSLSSASHDDETNDGITNESFSRESLQQQLQMLRGKPFSSHKNDEKNKSGPGSDAVPAPAASAATVTAEVPQNNEHQQHEDDDNDDGAEDRQDGETHLEGQHVQSGKEHGGRDDEYASSSTDSSTSSTTPTSIATTAADVDDVQQEEETPITTPSSDDGRKVW